MHSFPNNNNNVVVFLWIALFFFSPFVLAKVDYNEILSEAHGLVRIPGGRSVLPECLVELPLGARMLGTDRIQLENGTINPIPGCTHNSTENTPERHKRDGTGWNVWSYYYTGSNFNEYDGNWVVPKGNAAQNTGQTLFFFTGLENIQTGNLILQPVVWYSGATNSWSAACWMAPPSGPAVYSPIVAVWPGESIVTKMHRTPGSGWSCSIAANGVVVTSGNFADAIFNWAFVTLEAVSATTCASFPYKQATTFYNLNLVTDTSPVPTTFNNAFWNINTYYTDCGQSMACNGNLCTMTYGLQNVCPPNVGTGIFQNGVLRSNGIASAVSSDYCRLVLTMQGDGNLVYYNQFGVAIWASNTGGVGVGPFTFIVQGDANMVIYDSRGIATWASGSTGRGVAPYSLNPQSDGQLVLYDSRVIAIWASGTQG